jgi:hypothetical protein
MSCGKIESGIFIYSYQSRCISSYMFLMLAPAKGAPFVLIVLFQRSFEETMSVVRVVSFKWIIDKIPANSDANTVGVLLLWVIFNHNASIHYRAVCGDATNLFVREEEDIVGSLGDTFLPWARQWTSLLIAGTQRCLSTGSCCIFLY